MSPGWAVCCAVRRGPDRRKCCGRRRKKLRSEAKRPRRVRAGAVLREVKDPSSVESTAETFSRHFRMRATQRMPVSRLLTKGRLIPPLTPSTERGKPACLRNSRYIFRQSPSPSKSIRVWGVFVPGNEGNREPAGTRPQSTQLAGAGNRICLHTGCLQQDSKNDGLHSQCPLPV